MATEKLLTRSQTNVFKEYRHHYHERDQEVPEVSSVVTRANDDIKRQLEKARQVISGVKKEISVARLDAFDANQTQKVEVLKAKGQQQINGLVSKLKSLRTLKVPAEERVVLQNMITSYGQQTQDLLIEFRGFLNTDDRFVKHVDTADPFEIDEPPQFQQQLMEEDRLLDIEAQIEDLEQGIRQIATGVQEIAQIFRDLDMLINDQQKPLDQIEANVESTVTHLDGANTQLGQAETYQKKYQKRLCWLCLGLLILILVILLILKLV